MGSPPGSDGSRASIWDRGEAQDTGSLVPAMMDLSLNPTTCQGRTQARKVALVMVEQGLGLGWAKKSGGSGLIAGSVLWYQSESGAQQQLGPSRAGLTSATAPASGSRSRAQSLDSTDCSLS